MAALRWTALLLTAALVVTFAACGGKGGEADPSGLQPTTAGDLTTSLPALVTEEIPAWSIEVRGVPTVTRFTSVDAQYLPKVEVSMTMQNQYGVSVTNRYGGVTLRSLLNLFYVPDVLSVIVTTKDGATVTYPQHMAMAADTVLAWEIDGAPIDTPQNPLRMCPGSGGGTDMFVDGVAAIVVSPNDGSVTTTLPDDPFSTLSSTFPPFDPNANTYTLPPTIPYTTEATEPTTTTTTRSTRTTRPSRPPYIYTEPPTKPTTQRPTTSTSASTSTSSTSSVYDPFR